MWPRYLRYLVHLTDLVHGMCMHVSCTGHIRGQATFIGLSRFCAGAHQLALAMRLAFRNSAWVPR